MDQAEQLRNIIKTKQLRRKSSARVLTITSGKGGVGKSNVSINLGIQLQKMGKKVLILDADFGLANIEVLFGAIPQYTLRDVIEGKKSLEDTITKGPLDIQFISGGTGVEGMANLNKVQLTNLLRNIPKLDELADVIIIDTGAGISDSVLEFVAAGSEVLLVSTPEPTSLTDAYSLLKSLYHYDGFSKQDTKIRIIANRVSNTIEGKNLHKKLNIVSEKFLGLSLDYLGSVPIDDQLVKAVMAQSPVTISYPKARSSKAFEKLAMDLLKENTEETEKRKSLSQIFQSFFQTNSK